MVDSLYKEQVFGPDKVCVCAGAMHLIEWIKGSVFNVISRCSSCPAMPNISKQATMVKAFDANDNFITYWYQEPNMTSSFPLSGVRLRLRTYSCNRIMDELLFHGQSPLICTLVHSQIDSVTEEGDPKCPFLDPPPMTGMYPYPV